MKALLLAALVAIGPAPYRASSLARWRLAVTPLLTNLGRFLNFLGRLRDRLWRKR